MDRTLIKSTYNGFNFYRLFNNRFDFEIETNLENGDCLSVKTNDNARVTKWLDASAECVDSSEALAIINQGIDYEC